MLADFLYGLLIVATLLAVIGIFRLARRLRRSSGTPTERLLVMTFLLLVLLAILFLFLRGQINDLRSSRGEVEKSTQQLFVEKVYPPLAEAQFQLDYQLKQLAILQKRIFELSRNHPQQSSRLQLAYNTWKSERQGLSQLKLKVSRAVRHAMGLHKVSDQTFVESAFNREAVDWEQIITDRLSQYHDSQLKVTNAMIDNAMLQNRNITTFRRGKHTHVVSGDSVLKSEFEPRTIAPLMAYLEKGDSSTADSLTAIGKQISTATQKRREVRNYSLEHPDLVPVLQKVIEGWLQLENKGVYYRDQLLHAIQADYLAVLLGTNKNDNQLLKLRKSVSVQSRTLLDELQASREVLEKSYQTAPR